MLAQLNNISFNHVFLIKKHDISGQMLLLHMPSVTIVYGAKQMPIETKKELHSELVDEQRNFWIQAL